MKKILAFSTAIFTMFVTTFSARAMNEKKADSCIDAICKYTCALKKDTDTTCRNIRNSYIMLVSFCNAQELTRGICTSLGSLPKSGPIRITHSEFEKIGLKFDTNKSYDLNVVIKIIISKICEIMSGLIKLEKLSPIKSYIEGFIKALNE